MNLYIAISLQISIKFCTNVLTMTVCVGDRHDAVRRSAHSADPRLYVGGVPEGNHLLRDSSLE